MKLRMVKIELNKKIKIFNANFYFKFYISLFFSSSNSLFEF